MKVSVEFEYQRAGDVTMAKDGTLLFPSLPAIPGMYRFRLLGPSEAISTYIGESDNLRRRSAHYRNPGPTQKTNLRMQAQLRTHFERGGTVEFSMVTTATLAVGRDAMPLNLSLTAHRRLLENAALVSNPKAESLENL
jgi:hypothetical protein